MKQPLVGRIGSGLLSAGQFVSIVALSLIGGLMVWAVLPLVLGWSSHAVITGSMSPQVQVGDVLVSAPPQEGQLEPGMVAIFDDPAHPERVLSHRITEIAEDGSLTTQGDANPSADLLPVPVENVIGVARLRIPLIGQPAVWFGDGQYGLVLLTLVGLAGMTALAVWPDRREPEPETAPPALDGPWPWLANPSPSGPPPRVIVPAKTLNPVA